MTLSLTDTRFHSHKAVKGLAVRGINIGDVRNNAANFKFVFIAGRWFFYCSFCAS
jgi:hypothetical protein